MLSLSSRVGHVEHMQDRALAAERDDSAAARFEILATGAVHS